MNENKTKLIKKFVKQSYGNRRDYKLLKKEYNLMNTTEKSKESARMREILHYAQNTQ